MIKVHVREVVDTGTTWTEIVEFMRVELAIKCFQKNDLV